MLAPEDRAAILDALSLKDLDPNLRARVYMYLNRLGEDVAPAAVLAKWAEAKVDKSTNGRLLFLQEWAKDTSFGRFELRETQQRRVEDEDDDQWDWLSEPELVAKLNAWGSDEGRGYARDLIASAKRSKPHPMRPKDRVPRHAASAALRPPLPPLAPPIPPPPARPAAPAGHRCTRRPYRRTPGRFGHARTSAPGRGRARRRAGAATPARRRSGGAWRGAGLA
jgi:hypothetical protein